MQSVASGRASRRLAEISSPPARASNGLAESTNTRVRLLHRVAFGFHSAAPLIALAMLKLGGLCPPLPRERRPRLRR
jgi:hypothetical protein